jgi:DNA primase
MAYGIPQETIEQVRGQSDIVQLVSEYLTLKKAGSNFRALCPFHNEKTPSFMVSPSKQIFHCFGCGAGGNVFGFLMKQEGLTFPESVRFLADRLGIRIKQDNYNAGHEDLRERLFDLHEYGRRFYHQCLLKSPGAEHARKYLEERSMSEAAIKGFSLGYSPREWDSFITAAVKKGFSREFVVEAGLAKKSAEGRIYDAFRNRVMFPIWGLSGKVVAFGGRTLEENQPKYINSPETPIYHKGAILYNLSRARKSVSRENSVIVVEGYTDAIRVSLGGIENVVASSGTAFTQAQARLIKRYAEDVVLVFDSDSAGMTAAGRGIEVLLGEDLGVKAAVLPPGKDPDEFVLESGAEAFADLVAKAKNFVEFHIESTLAGKDGAGIDGKIKAARLLAGLVGRIPDPIRREEYIRVIASRLDVRPEALAEASQKSAPEDKLEEAGGSQRKLRREEKELVWLAKMLIEHPENIETVRGHLGKTEIEDKALKELFEVIFECGAEGIESGSLLDKVQGNEAQQLLSKLMFEETFRKDPFYEPQWWREHMDSREEKKKSRELSREIAEAERNGNIELLNKLLAEKFEKKEKLVRIKGNISKVSVDRPA